MRTLKENNNGLENIKYELELFAGRGGGIYAGLLLGHTCIGACEYDEDARKVLLARQRDGIFPEFPIWDDITTFTRENKECEAYFKFLDSIKDELVIKGGFPCQAHSKATHGKSTAKCYWPDMFRVIREVKPKAVFAENVDESAIVTAGLDLWEEGYDFNYCSLSAKDLGADHKRERFWLFAHSDMHSEFRGEVNAEAQMLPELCRGVWTTDPTKFRVANGLAGRRNRLVGGGNGQVPIVAKLAWNILTELV